MIRPVAAPISQRFGDNPTRDMPWNSWLIQTFGNYQPDGHSGEDYACDVGTPVRAVASGVVLHIGYMGGTYADNPWWIAPGFAGYCAVVDHGSFIGIYGHCMDGSAKVRKGDRVAEGRVFILSGNTGGSTGPHLHFEILPDQYVLNSAFYGRVNPEPYFVGSLSYAGTTVTPIQEEPLVPNQNDEVFYHLDGGPQISLNAFLNDIIRESRSAAAATRALLAVQIPDPSEPGKTYALADYIVWGATNAKLAAGSAAIAAGNTDPAALTKAVSEAQAGATAQDIADRLTVTVKESK